MSAVYCECGTYLGREDRLSNDALLDDESVPWCSVECLFEHSPEKTEKVCAACQDRFDDKDRVIACLMLHAAEVDPEDACAYCGESLEAGIDYRAIIRTRNQ
jgi:hypothetical protein